MDAFTLRTGTILAYSPKTNTYSVATYGVDNSTSYNCMYLGEDSGTLAGPNETAVIASGVNVALFVRDVGDTGYIIGTTSRRELTSGKVQEPLNITPFSNTPEDFNQPHHDETASLFDTASLPSNFHPMSEYPGATQGSTSELGSGYGHTPSTAFIKSSELAGVWTFLLDNTTRVAGFNFEFWHSGGDRTIKCMGGQIEDIERSTPYLFESLGSNEFGTVVIPQDILSRLEEEDTKAQARSELYAVLQSNLRQHEYPDALYRHLRIKNTQGDTEYVVRQGTTYPKGDPQGTTGLEDASKSIEVSRSIEQQNEPVTTGLAKISKKLDGSIEYKSAKGIKWVKDVRIPVPFQKKRPEEVKDTRELNSKDYWEEKELGALTSSFTEEQYTRGALDKFEYPIPPNVDLQVDPDTKETYYASESVVEQHDDGSISLKDGYGACIMMSKGNIVMSCPGDIIQLPGRDAITHAGADVMTKGQKNVEISASTESVRIKADENLSMIGGNSGQGGVLVSNKAMSTQEEASSTGGLVLSSESFIGLGASNIGITGRTEDTTTVTLEGNLDAKDVSANNINAVHLYADKADITASNINLLDASMGVFGGKAAFCAIADQAIGALTAGSLGSTGAPIPPITKGAGSPSTKAPHFVPLLGPQLNTLLQPSSPKGSPAANISMFTFRSITELGYTGEYKFALPPMEWQKMATGIWVEPTVNGTLPHPAEAPTGYKITTKE